MAKTRSIHHKIRQSQNRRGNFAEKVVFRALVNLRDYYGVPIIIIVSGKGDHRDRSGIDFEIKGAAPLNARFGIDVKNSRSGVKNYLRKQQELAEAGVRNAFSRYPFLFQHEPFDMLELKLLKLILEKSENYSNVAQKVPDYKEIAGPNFREDLKHFIASVFP